MALPNGWRLIPFDSCRLRRHRDRELVERLTASRLIPLRGMSRILRPRSGLDPERSRGVERLRRGMYTLIEKIQPIQLPHNLANDYGHRHHHPTRASGAAAG